MLKKDLLEKIKNAKDDEDINSLLTGTDIEDQFAAAGLTLEAVKSKFKTDKDFKTFIESEKINHFNKTLDTWKKENLEKELEPFIQEKYPDLVTDPVQKELSALKKQLADEKAANARKDLLSEAIKYAADKKLPASIVEKCLGEDLETTKTLIDGIATDWASGLEAIATEKMKASSYVPGKGSDGKPISIGSLIAQQTNSKTSTPSNPWEDK